MLSVLLGFFDLGAAMEREMEMVEGCVSIEGVDEVEWKRMDTYPASVQ